MAILPHDISGGTIVDGAKIQQNDAALETILEGELTEANFSGATQIPQSMIADTAFEVVVPISFRGGETNGGNDLWLNVDNTVQAIGNLPYASANTSYTIRNITIAYRCTYAANSPNFTIEWGYSNAGTWTIAAGAGGVGVVNVNAYSLVGATTVLTGPVAMTVVGSTITTNSLQPRCFAIVSDGTDAGFTGAGDFLDVTITLARELF